MAATKIGTTAFTLVELLVVIGIIAVLLAILVPGVGRMRLMADDTNTRNEIQQIAQACDNYYNDFRAYPGPVSNTDIEGPNPPEPTIPQPAINIMASTNFGSMLVNGASSQGVSPKATNPRSANAGLMHLTASENLVLGLCGGLWMNNITGNPNLGKVEYLGIYYSSPSAAPVSPTDSSYGYPKSTLIGPGPQTLVNSVNSPASFRQFTAYLALSFPGSKLMENGDGSFETGQYTTATGQTFQDCFVPVFTDQYQSPMPILYMRARAGAPGVISGPSTYASPTTLIQDGNGNTLVANYDVREITPYTTPAVTPPTSVGSNPAVAPFGVGLGATNGIVINNVATGQHGLQGIGSVGTSTISWSSSGPTPVPVNTLDNAGQYFLNASIQPSNTTAGGNQALLINATGTPRAKDEYILISAGRDRTYGTSDDITSFGNVQP